MTRKVSIGLLCVMFVGILSPVVFADNGASAASNEHDSLKFIALAIGLGLGIAVFGGAIGQSRAIAAAVEAIARQPEAGGRIFNAMIIGLALIETLVIYIWVTCAFIKPWV